MKPIYEPRGKAKEYGDHEKHSCPRFNAVIKSTVEEMKKAERKNGKWIYNEALEAFECSACRGLAVRNIFYYCPWCGADMRERKEE